MPKIFISYRREDSQSVSDRLHEKLEDCFGTKNVFFDVDSIPVGRNFVEYLDEQVSQCDVLLAVIGTRWLEARDEEGACRLQDKNDFVRIEITSGLKRDDITVVPVLVEGAKIPKKSMLPAGMEELSLLNAAEVRPGRDFRRDVNDLIKALESIEPTAREIGTESSERGLERLFDLNNPDHVKIEKAIRGELNSTAEKVAEMAQRSPWHKQKYHEQVYSGSFTLITGKLTKADLVRVTSLNLGRNQLTDVSPLKELSQLTYLDLSFNQISDVSALVSALKELTKLTELDLEGNPISDVSVLKKLRQLELLNLSTNPKLDLSTLKELEQLLVLEITDSPIIDMSALGSALRELTQLTVLILSRNQISDVSPLKELSQLMDLELSFNQISDVSPLAKLTQLKSLYLSNNQLSNVSVLIGLTKLTHLDLDNNPDLTRAQIDELQKALPKCDIRCDISHNSEKVTSNNEEDIISCRRAAEENDPEAQFNLGHMYESGQGVEKDLHEAIAWYLKAAAQNEPQAQNNLGYMYETGQGVDKDLKEAAKWYRKAAEQGNENAKAALMDILEH